FFQAEDGIRDDLVTGVQTCALPIFSLRLADVDHDGEQLRVEGKGRKTRFVPIGEPAMAAVRAYLERARSALTRAAPSERDAESRSEERRVGEGWGCRGVRGEGAERR